MSNELIHKNRQLGVRFKVSRHRTSSKEWRPRQTRYRPV